MYIHGSKIIRLVNCPSLVLQISMSVWRTMCVLRTALTLLVVSCAAAWQVMTSSTEQNVRVSIMTSTTYTVYNY